MSTSPRAPGQGQNLVQAISEAQSIIDAAERRASERLSEAESAYERAKLAGYDEGFKRGLDEAAKNAVQLIRETGGLKEKLAHEAAELALKIGSIVVGEHLKVSPESIRTIALKALGSSMIGSRVQIITNPEDSIVLENSLEMLRRVANTAEIALETIPDMARGGCVVRSQFGEVDCSVESLLGAVADRIGVSSIRK